MKTDTLFYELFQAAPQTFFELMQITPCPYRFESITVKVSENVNIFKPLLAENESDVTRNVEQWVENIRQEPTLDAHTEEKLIGVMLQLIEQKFKTLTYRELSEMLKLIPLAETTSGQEILKDDRIFTLSKAVPQNKMPTS